MTKWPWVHRKAWVSRKICQWLALAVIVALPMVSRGSAIYEALGAGAHHVPDLTSMWEGALFKAFSVLFGGFSDPAAVANLFQGGYWSITLFGVTFNDPLAALGHVVATRSVHWPLVGGTLVAVALALFAGRAFCGWICPVNTILEINEPLRRMLEARVTRTKFPKWMPGLRPRVAILLAGLIFSAGAGFNGFVLILPYAALARDIHLAVYGAGVGFGVFFLAVLMAVELAAVPRIWCRSLCPTGLVLGWLGRVRRFGISRKAGRDCLSGCQLCITTCRFGVLPRDQVLTNECVLCNECVTHCPADVLQLGFTRPLSNPGPSAQANAQPTASRKRSPQVMALALAAISALALASDARAHHIKGMPHYGYAENYPQTPTYERRVSAPPYQVTVVVYGLDGPGGQRTSAAIDGMIYVSLMNRATNQPYTGALAVTLRPIGGGKQKTVTFKAPIEETVYRLRAKLVADAYDVAVQVPGPPRIVAHVRIDLDPGLNRWVVASGAVLAAVFAWVGVLVLRRRRRRRNRPMGTRG